MSVLLETSKGDLVIDLHYQQAPQACVNFLKLCKIKYYNHSLIHLVQRSRLIQTGDPLGTGAGGSSVWGLIEGESRRFFPDEFSKALRHDKVGTVSMANTGPDTNASQFIITTGPAMHHLDDVHVVFGEVAEGLDTLAAIDGAYCDADGRPYQNIRIRHTIILHDPFDDPPGLRVPDRSPSPTAEQIRQDRERLADDEALDGMDGKTAEEVQEALAAQAAKSHAEVLEMLGDLPDADIAPPENVLFVCKLNPVTQDDDLEIIFSRFGDIKKCEVIRDFKTGESLNYAFIEYAAKEQCETAYLKMDGVLIDDRRIRVDFSQSVAKTWNRYRRKERMDALPEDDQGGGGGSRGRGGGLRGGPGRGRGGGGRGGGILLGGPRPPSGTAPPGLTLRPGLQPQQPHGGPPLVFDLPHQPGAPALGPAQLPPPPPPPQAGAGAQRVGAERDSRDRAGRHTDRWEGGYHSAHHEVRNVRHDDERHGRDDGGGGKHDKHDKHDKHSKHGKHGKHDKHDKHEKRKHHDKHDKKQHSHKHHRSRSRSRSRSPNKRRRASDSEREQQQ